MPGSGESRPLRWCHALSARKALTVRVLVLADRTSHADPARLASRPDIDAVLFLGDLQPSWIETLDGVQVPKVGVYGNHDPDPYMDWYGIENAHLRRIELEGGTSISGFEGSVTYRRSDHSRVGPSYSQKEAAKLIRKLPPADILISHSPPYGVNDHPDDPAHVGFEALRDWVLEHRPRVLLHGHTYPQPGQLVDRIGDTRVVYVHGARIVDL
jgi:Icc-related predicted phosphoesterase